MLPAQKEKNKVAIPPYCYTSLLPGQSKQQGFLLLSGKLTHIPICATATKKISH